MAKLSKTSSANHMSEFAVLFAVLTASFDPSVAYCLAMLVLVVILGTRKRSL